MEGDRVRPGRIEQSDLGGIFLSDAVSLAAQAARWHRSLRLASLEKALRHSTNLANQLI